MKTWWMGWALCALVAAPGLATAGSNDGTPTMEASMVVTGTIVVRPDGSVASYALDNPGEVLPGAREELARAVPQWKFDPTVRHGKAVQVTSPMSVRLVAKPAGNGKYDVTVGGAHFGQCKTGACLTWNKRVEPRYPRAMQGIWPAHFHGAAHMATVYVTLQVGRDGRVQRVALRQVNLAIRGSADDMQRWRSAYGEAVMAVAKRWTFHVPVQGPTADNGHRLVNTAVVFNARSYSDRRPWVGRYGHWQSYLPGPRHYIPWADQNTVADQGADAIPAGGGVYSVHQTLHLLSSLGGP